MLHISSSIMLYILLERLISIGITGIPLDWFKTFI